MFMNKHNDIAKDFSATVRRTLAKKSIIVTRSTWLPVSSGDSQNGARLHAERQRNQQDSQLVAGCRDGSVTGRSTRNAAIASAIASGAPASTSRRACGITPQRAWQIAAAGGVEACTPGRRRTEA